MLIACWRDIGENDMTERERLFDILADAVPDKEYADKIARYLLANGVSVPPCKVGEVKKLLCKFAHWILYKFEPIDVWQTKIRTKLSLSS